MEGNSMPRTSFRPEINAFAFANSWTFDENEPDQVRDIFASAINGALVLLGGPFLGGTLAAFGIGRTLTDWVTRAVVIPYGLCGGMAFAALDYYKTGLAIPRGTGPWDQPTRATPEGARLRTYLWERLLDSLKDNVASVLAWMAVLHQVPKGWPFRGGPRWLLAESKEHWNTLKKHIDAGEPWPLALVGTAQDPTSNHQVLAYGYEDPGDGTGTIYVYDMNSPGFCPPESQTATEQTIAVDFRGEMLAAMESCPNGARGPLRGFFCEVYRQVQPPDLG
jgi:hypothetical protein